MIIKKVILCLTLVIFLYSSCSVDNELYFNSFDLYLNGNIIYSEHHSSSWYINCVEVDSSNYTSFDQRDSLSSFLIVKKTNFAIFYMPADMKTNMLYQIGDSVEIKGNKRNLTCWNKYGKMKFNKKLRITRKSLFPLERINKLIYEFESGIRKID
ncbi:MAG: hypothetical protein K8R54_19015 [Bacteroidales bacterium]|nr:hypothetical protein [Bacteroidales bacterium]